LSLQLHQNQSSGAHTVDVLPTHHGRMPEF